MIFHPPKTPQQNSKSTEPINSSQDIPEITLPADLPTTLSNNTVSTDQYKNALDSPINVVVKQEPKLVFTFVLKLFLLAREKLYVFLINTSRFFIPFFYYYYYFRCFFVFFFLFFIIFITSTSKQRLQSRRCEQKPGFFPGQSRQFI